MSEAESLDEHSDESLQRQRQEQLGEFVDSCVEHGIDALIDALMSLGKTHAAAHVAARTGHKVTVFTRLWDTREQVKKEAMENTGLSKDEIIVLPSMNKHCESMAEDARHRNLIKTTQTQGATAKDIHNQLQKNIECQNEKAPCTYSQMCDFDADEKKLIIGHPSHAYVESYKNGRAVLVDEDAASAYEDEISSPKVDAAVNNLINRESMEDTIDFEKKSELHDLGLTEQMELVTELKKGEMIHSEYAMSQHGGRADSEMLLIHLLDNQRLENSRIRRTEFENGATIVSDYDDNGTVSIRRPPNFDMASCVIALDGTPTHDMWENRLGVELEHKEFMSTEEREHYVNEILGYNVFKTSDARKPYGSGEHCNPKEVFTLMESIYRKHGQKAAMITSKNAREKIQGKPRIIRQFAQVEHDLYFQNLRSKNDLKQFDLLAVVGSPSTGHAEVERLAAHDGYDVKITGRGDGKDFGEHGYRYFKHNAHNEVAQAIFRVGRADDIEASDIYVHTRCIPNWVPVTDVSTRVRNRTREEKLTIHAMMDAEGATTKTIAEKVDHTRETVRRHLETLSMDGYVEKSSSGQSSFWVDTGLDDAPYWGQMDLE
jgi:hypothetical protein